MKVKIIKPLQGGEIKAPTSKSHLHRILIASALSGISSPLPDEARSEDIAATERCLDALMCQWGTPLESQPPSPKGNVKTLPLLDCGDSGTTLRLLLPIAAALGKEVLFKGSTQLMSRPMEPLIQALTNHGCTVKMIDSTTLHLAGQLTGGDFSLPGDVSSQYISGLLMALPLLDCPCKICLTTPLQSAPYVDMTLNVLAKAGISWERQGDVFSLSCGQRYSLPQAVVPEGDWSNAAFWLAAGGFSKEGILCHGLSADSIQGDKKVLQVLAAAGGEIGPGENGIFSGLGNFHGFKFDAVQYPDIVPALAAVGAVAHGTTEIFNAERLRYKESDRIKSIADVINGLGGKAEEMTDGLLIHGVPRLKGGTVSSHGDHRIVMMAAVLAMKCENPAIIENAEAVNKSYPGFFADYKNLGGALEWL